MDSRRERDRNSKDYYRRDRRDYRDRIDDRDFREDKGDREYRRSRSRSRERGDREYRNREEYSKSSSRIRDDTRSYSRTDSRSEYREPRREAHNSPANQRIHSPREHSHSRTHSHAQPSHKPKPSTNYDLPTTESLHAKKLAALDHEKFLEERQKERMAKGEVEGLWPKTPPRAEFYYGEFLKLVEEDIKEEIVEEKGEIVTEGIEQETSETVDKPVVESDSDEFGVKIKVKAPSASKPSINSFSTSKPTRYGGDLMPGEGTAMAGFIAQGQRIPRRGEIGMDSNQISRFETAGYVMSGSRHHMMNAVRMRKENQVISAEEKRMILQMALEERVKREEEIVRTFKSMVEEKMKQQQKK